MGHTPDRHRHGIVPSSRSPRQRQQVRKDMQVALIHRVVAALQRDDKGQGLAEYALILALIAIVAIIALIFLGNQVSGILSTVGSSV
jgi:Flp pilus assembly pilin Flp